ncbi:MAG: hypothetical protein M1830_005373 [Pleopsidium flavum]|nr:MAG: hypothetical protein M1830_005373 [Pleopsidium flavum]
MTATTAAGNQSAAGVTVQPRGLSQITDSATTLVNSDGYTFTSPSIYIVFPTIHAADECGYIGSVHKSVTRAFAPDQISTAVVLNDASTLYFPFDYADAQCPPSSLSALNAWTILGQAGNYNPVISPPSGLSLIDPTWNQLCEAAPFQGNDPPHALMPAANLVPSTTNVNDPLPTATPASPIRSVSVLPERTSGTETSVWAQSSQTEVAQPASSGSPIPAPISYTKSTQSQDDPNDPASARPQPTQTQQGPNAPASSEAQTLQMTEYPAGPESVASASASDPALAPITVAGQAYQANPMSTSAIDSQTSSPNGAITASGTTLSAAIDASSTVVGSTTLRINSLPTNAPPLIIIASQTLPPGGAITISNTPISRPASRSYLLIDGTSTFPYAASTSSAQVLTIAGQPFTLSIAPAAPSIPVLTFANQPYTANSASAFVIADQTLVPGGAITVSGTPVSLAATPTDVGTSTERVGAWIMQGLGGGGGGGANGNATVSTFDGRGQRRGGGLRRWLVVWGVGMGSGRWLLGRMW